MSSRPLRDEGGQFDRGGANRLGAQWAEGLGPDGHWIGLRGELGAGKSVLARAIGRALGVFEEMPSPTYTLLRLYEGRGRPVVHLDLYRLRSTDELQELGWEDLGQAGQVVLVEWPERAGPFWPEDAIELSLAVEPGVPERRNLVISGGPPEPTTPSQ